MTSSSKPIGPGGTIRIDEADEFRANVARAVRAELAPMLVVIAGPDVGSSTRLEGSVTIGRGGSGGLVLTDASVSTAHVRIEDRGEAWAVVDLGSTNGMRVDDQRVDVAILEDTRGSRSGRRSSASRCTTRPNGRTTTWSSTSSASTT